MQLQRTLSSPIKSIQRGVITSINNTPTEVTISSVDIGKSLLIMSASNTLNTPGSYAHLGSNTTSGRIKTNTKIEFVCGGSANGRVFWEVIEYV